MSFIIITKNGEQEFRNKDLVNICSKTGYDCQLNLGFDFMITVQFNPTNGKCSILNPYNCQNFLFKGQILPSQLEIDKVCKIMVKDSDEFITIKNNFAGATVKLNEENITEEEIKSLYGDDVNSAAKLKIEKRKVEIQTAHSAIIKQISYKLNDLKNKISMNSKTGIILHLTLLVASLVLGFGTSNYITGLPLVDAANIIQMPVNMKLLLIYTLVVYGIGLTFKQGVFLFLQNKNEEFTSSSVIAEKFMIVSSSFFFVALYIINLLYYMSSNTMPVFAILMSLFFCGTCISLAFGCGYFKYNNIELTKELDKYEYREDFEFVIKEYQQWIERFINNFSNTKIRNIKDKIFMLQLKSVGETCIGVLTAPFLAFGVSNTLAMCFPEAAGWVRISGLRFSPVFLVLATFLIVFAFFAFVNAFFCNKRMHASNVLKNDGYSNYSQHGVEIFGLSGMKKLDVEMRRSMFIGLVIIFIEFSMNISYFMQEMGDDLSGLFLSATAALVPTALLIAETYMLSQTKFEINTLDEIITQLDRD